MTLLPGNDGIAQEVAARVARLVDTVGDGGMAGAERPWPNWRRFWTGRR